MGTCSGLCSDGPPPASTADAADAREATLRAFGGSNRCPAAAHQAEERRSGARQRTTLDRGAVSHADGFRFLRRGGNDRPPLLTGVRGVVGAGGLGLARLLGPIVPAEVVLRPTHARGVGLFFYFSFFPVFVASRADLTILK